jgi:hypothetical protein
MVSPSEREDIRQVVYRELAELEHRISHYAGSYKYLCLVQGGPCFTHTPCGPVLRTIR